MELEIFNYMKDIYFDDFEHFIERVDRSREVMLEADISLLNNDNGLLDLDKSTYIPNGRLRVVHKGIDFECFFHYKSEKRLYVILNGALCGKPPAFGRWSYYSYLDGCMLNISDPMYRLYSNLQLGWYYGHDEYDLREYIVEIVNKIAHVLKIENQNIIFLGSSGGGAATIECAGLMQGAKSVAINPQIILSEHKYAEEFTKITGNDLNKDDIFKRNNPIYWLKSVGKSYHIFIFNIRSDEDMYQVKNICSQLDISLKYGLNVFEGFIIWLYDAECRPFKAEHSTQEYYCIVFVIEFLIKNIKIKDLERRYGAFIRLINEFWYFYWKEWKQQRLSSGKIDLSKLIMCRESNKKIILWGTGKVASRLSRELFDIHNNNYYEICMILDNNKDKEGTYFENKILIRHPSSISDWSDFFVIIAIRDYEDVHRQLETLGLQYYKDFIYSDDLYEYLPL